MLRSDEQWLSLADKFYSAAVDTNQWYPALEGLAAATGSRSGELIGIGNDAAVPFNLMTNVDPLLADEFVACDGGNPAINPRVNAGMNAPVLQILAESDFLAPDAHAHHPHYNEFAFPWDVPYICLTTLERRDDSLIGLAVLRSQRQGHISAEERDVFASLASHVRGAVRMQMALEGSGAALVTGALETVSIAAFVCDRTGRVQGVTKQAEQIVSAGNALQLRNHRLRAARETEDKALTAAIELAAGGLRGPKSPPPQTVVVHGTGAPVVLDVFSLPSITFEFNARPRVVVLVRSPRDGDARRTTILQSVYLLTAAETEIALRVAQGKTVEAIAQERRVAVGTVRSQIKSVFAKLGVSRQIELVARLNLF